MVMDEPAGVIGADMAVGQYDIAVILAVLNVLTPKLLCRGKIDYTICLRE